MARTRSIKPGFFDNDVLGDLPPITRLLFIGLWCIADRDGRLEDRPRKIKKAILGYDDVDSDAVDSMLQALHSAGFIIRYEANSSNFIQIINFVKHQNPHMKEKPSEIPPPKGFDPGTYTEPRGYSTGHTPDKHDKSLGEDAPFTYNLLPITGTPSPSTAAEPEEDEEQNDGKSKSLLENRFELFWKAYPKKKAKKTAWNAFKKIKPDEALFSRIMEAIGRYRTSQEWQRDGGQYIPHPATWLNGGCWDDEIEEVKQNAEHNGHPGPNPGKPTSAAPGTRKPNATAGFKPAGDE